MFELTGEKRSGKKRRKTARGGKNEVEEERRKGGEGYHASGSKAVRHQYVPYSLLSATIEYFIYAKAIIQRSVSYPKAVLSLIMIESSPKYMLRMSLRALG